MKSMERYLFRCLGWSLLLSVPACSEDDTDMTETMPTCPVITTCNPEWKKA